jgi:hypothetical protein
MLVFQVSVLILWPFLERIPQEAAGSRSVAKGWLLDPTSHSQHLLRVSAILSTKWVARRL